MTNSFLKYVLPVLIVLAVIGFIIFKPFQSDKRGSSDKLVVGLQSGYPPFEFMDAAGKIVGFDVDLAQIIAERLNKTLVIEDMEFEGEILSLKQGKIDLIISGMNITPSRLKEIWLVPYHGENVTSFSLVFWKEVPAAVQSLEDIARLPNPTVSVESGSIAESYLANYPQIHAKSFQGSLAPLMDVKYGKSVANLVQPDVAEYLKQQHPEIKILSVPLTPEESVLGFGIGIKKGNQQLLNEVQEIIQQLKNSGELQALENKWFREGG